MTFGNAWWYELLSIATSLCNIWCPCWYCYRAYQCCCGIAAILQRKHNKKILNRMIDECIFHSSVGFDTCEQDKNLLQALQHSITFPTAEKMRRGKREKHTHTRTRTHGHIHGFHTHINRCIFNNAISNQKREKKNIVLYHRKKYKKWNNDRDDWMRCTVEAYWEWNISVWMSLILSAQIHLHLCNIIFSNPCIFIGHNIHFCFCILFSVFHQFELFSSHQNQ